MALDLLVVDDDPALQLMYRTLLEGYTIQSCIVGSLQEARTVLAQHRPRACILDYNLQGGNSLELARELQGIDVYFLSGMHPETIMESAKARGIHPKEIWTKPFVLEYVIALFEDLSGTTADTQSVTNRQY